jgi:hypothetical protein
LKNVNLKMENAKWPSVGREEVFKNFTICNL